MWLEESLDSWQGFWSGDRGVFVPGGTQSNPGEMYSLRKRIVLAQTAKVRLGTSLHAGVHSFSDLVRRDVLGPQIQTHPSGDSGLVIGRLASWDDRVF